MIHEEANKDFENAAIFKAIEDGFADAAKQLFMTLWLESNDKPEDHFDGDIFAGTCKKLIDSRRRAIVAAKKMLAEIRAASPGSEPKGL
jgi:hypothetical protein